MSSQFIESFVRANAHSISSGNQDRDWKESEDIINKAQSDGLNYYHNTNEEPNILYFDTNNPEISILIIKTKNGVKEKKFRNSIEEKNGKKYLVLRLVKKKKIHIAWELPLEKGKKNCNCVSKDNIFNEDEYGGHRPDLHRYLEYPLVFG